MKELNLAEILKDCPKGTKLYSPICGECTFEGFYNDSKYPIIVCATDSIPFCFTADGRYFCNEDAEYLLFPSKDQRDWSTFQRPFKDGDILTTDLGSVFMLKETSEKEYYYSCYIALNHVSRTLGVYTQFCAKKDCRLATEEEKQELFQAIKDNGYKWNAETKTLEKLIELKYRLTEETKQWFGYSLHRIEALRDFGEVKAGDKGGWIEKEENLSHTGDAWVYGEAKVYDDARVFDNARVFDYARILDNASISGNTQIHGCAEISDDAYVRGNAHIYSNAQVGGRAVVDGDVNIGENAQVYGDAHISNNGDFIVFKNWWSSGRYFTWTRSNNKWKAGCFHGNSDELIRQAYFGSEISGREYERVVKYVESILADEKNE